MRGTPSEASSSRPTAANFGQSPRSFSQGDFNYDGVVDLQDFNILASRFGSVGPAAAPARAPATSVFGGSRIGEDLDDLVA